MYVGMGNSRGLGMENIVLVLGMGNKCAVRGGVGR